MELVNPEVSAYLEASCKAIRNEPILDEMEELAREKHFPIIGPLVGQACYLHALSMGARRIFELGSGYGYSTFWFARAVEHAGGGEVHHVVWDEGLSAQAREFLGRAGLAQYVTFHVAEAVSELQKDGADPYDIVFMDIDKPAYPEALPVIKPKLRRGGLLLVDNALQRGDILDPANQERNAVAVREMNRIVFEDPDYVAAINPLRDGLLVAYRK